MSRLEMTAKPVLERLWLNELSRLSSKEVAVLSRWAVKTAWMHERATHEQPTPTIEQRRSLVSEALPPNTRVWASRYAGERNFGCPIVQLTIKHQAQPWNWRESRRVLIAIAVCNGLALMVRNDDGPGAPPFQPDDAGWLQLWPRFTRGTLPWPPQRLVTDDEIEWRLKYHGDWARLPDVPVFERDGRGWQESL